MGQDRRPLLHAAVDGTPGAALGDFDDVASGETQATTELDRTFAIAGCEVPFGSGFEAADRRDEQTHASGAPRHRSDAQPASRSVVGRSAPHIFSRL